MNSCAGPTCSRPRKSRSLKTVRGLSEWVAWEGCFVIEFRPRAPRRMKTVVACRGQKHGARKDKLEGVRCQTKTGKRKITSGQTRRTRPCVTAKTRVHKEPSRVTRHEMNQT